MTTNNPAVGPVSIHPETVRTACTGGEQPPIKAGTRPAEQGTVLTPTAPSGLQDGRRKQRGRGQ